jgi:hypothetical protein
MKHRQEEDDLYRIFARQREEEDNRIKQEFRVSYILLNLDLVWLGDFKQEGYQPEISLANEIAKVECEGHPLGNFL